MSIIEIILFYFFIILITFLQTYILYTYFNGFFSFKVNKKIFIIISFIYMIMIKFIPDNILGRILLFIFFMLILASLTLNGSIEKKTYHVISFVFSLTLFENTYATFALSDISSNDIIKVAIYFIINIIFYFSVIAIIKVLMYYREDNAIGLTSREYLILSIIPASSLVILYLISDLSPLLRLISCINLILINLSYLIIYNKFLKENYERQRFLEIEKQNHYYHQQIINQDEIRKLKHDLKNILITIDSSIQNNDVIQAQKQIDTLLHTKVLQYDKYTGCIAIDSILTSKLLEMKKHNITYTTNLKIPNNLEINHNLLIDISAIWGNLLDNAIEGVLRLNKDKQKIINITVNYDRGKLIFNIQNTANLIKTDISNKLIKSEKGKRYGIGISSIKERVDRLKGYYDFNYHNEKYTALIIIPINKEISL